MKINIEKLEALALNAEGSVHEATRAAVRAENAAAEARRAAEDARAQLKVLAGALTDIAAGRLIVND